MARTRAAFFNRVQTVLSKFRRIVLLFILALLLAVSPRIVYAQDLLQQGRSLYETGRYSEAITVLQQAIRESEQAGDRRRQALTLSNLSLVYQQMNEWNQAEQAITRSLELLEQTSANSHQIAQALEVSGQLALSKGKPQKALENWRSATQRFEQVGDRVSASRVRLHQSRTLQHLGLYREAFNTLRSSPLELPTPALKSNCLRSLGNTIRVIGAIKLLDKSETGKKLSLSELAAVCRVNLANHDEKDYLHQAAQLLEKSQELVADLSPTWADILLDLGNLKRTQFHRSRDAYERVATQEEKQEISEFICGALEFYDKAIAQPLPSVQLQAKLNRFNFLVEVDRWLSEISKSEFTSLAKEITAQLKTQRDQIPALLNELDNLRTNTTTFQARLHLIQTLLLDKGTFDHQVIVSLLKKTQVQAQELGDRASESYAAGYLGQLQEKAEDWQQAYASTDIALKISETLQSAKMAYKWQWQQGRILRGMGDREQAIAAYETAISSLDTVRQDLLSSGNPDLQFSFRDQVEPVYRELVDLLLVANESRSENEELQKARSVISRLQIAQLENFLRCTLQVEDPVQLDSLADQHQAVIVYPILLSDRLATIVKLPGSETLQYHASKLSKEAKSKDLEANCSKLSQSYLFCDARIEAINKLITFRQQLESQEKDHLKLAGEIYEWLIRPFESNLNSSLSPKKFKTLVFILDNELRQIPLAALYDHQSKQYLVEKYAIVLNLGLKQEKSQALLRKPLTGLAGGLTRAEYKLENAGTELENIRKEILVRELRDEQFTQDNLQSKLNSSAFNIVHLVTHGEFTSNLETTGIQAFDGLINLNRIRDIFQIQSQNRPEPIDLLVLSACRTAAGDRRAPLGMAGMAVRSGARSTLASLWYTDDQRTVDLMKQFYINLNSIDSPGRAESLRRAQKTMIELKLKPVFWAQFVLLGNWL